MAVTTNDLKTYLHLPPDSTESLSLFLNAAIQTAKDADVPEYTDNARYDLYILQLAGMFYENRSLAISGAYPDVTVNNIKSMMNSNTLSLRYGEDGATNG